MKKRKLQKIMAVAVCSAMSASLIGGCGSEKTNTDSGKEATSTIADTEVAASEVKENDDSLFNEPGTLPIVKEPITLTVFAPANGEYRWEDNTHVQELEEKTGIHLEWQTAASSDDIKTKLSTLFASGDMPDIILTGVSAKNRYDKATVQSLAEQGLILPLTEYYDTVSVNYKKLLDEIDGFREYITQPDGNIYDIPNLDGSLHVQYNMKAWINQTWLDNLGLSMPETTDELYEVLKAFKEQDANGNGDPNDEIPLSTVVSGAGTQIDGFLMDPFQLISEESKLIIQDGKVTYAPVTDGYKEGLTYLNKLYSEGLINPESFTQDKDNQVNVNESGDECVIGVFLAQRPGYACDLSTEPYSKKWEQYRAMSPIEGPSGQKIASWNPYVRFQVGMTFISSTCSNPEAAFRLIDYLASEEMTYRQALGVEGVHYEMLDDSTTEVGLDGVTKAKYKRLNADTSNQTLGQLFGLTRTEEFISAEATNPDPYADDVKPLNGRQVVMYKASKEMEKYRQDISTVMPDLYMSSEDSAEMSLLKTNITDTQKQYMTQFITGERAIDTDWDNYLDALENVGLQRYLEMLQKAYDSSAFSG
ncbi:MAG: extracellular solute-binding protein [Butyrivibrio sp.]|uniref:extracellular solute-binding protein n=1 Tax=Butyrivibrio sp. TaxID=28121 RepID=UPI001B11A5B8|nr:extracellular solute-binding protein [Butyrivibrio sp.]MBO6239714.1 extracellular solute-binding protein [Butyrivibrio sp.]